MKKAVIILSVFLLLNFSVAEAQTGIIPCSGPNCQFCHIFVLINNIIGLVLTRLAPIVAALMLVIAGVMFLLAYLGEAEMLFGGGQGGPQLLSQAKKAVTATVVGLVIIFISWVFLNTFLTGIGVAEWTGFTDNPDTAETEGWWRIDCP